MLTGKNALQSDVNQPWEQTNQAWWDWYVTLADNSGQQTDELLEGPPLPTMESPSDAEISEELGSPYTLTQRHREAFCRDGFIKLANVLTPGAVIRLRQELIRLLGETFNTSLDGGARDRFLSLEMAWLDNPVVRAYVLSARIGKICAELLDVKSVRLYHDNILSKEPGCGRTPWHYDDHHFPLATDDVVTAWIPAQPVPVAMGPLSFAKPLDVFELVKDIEFNKFDTSYDRRVAEAFEASNVAIEDGAFDIGEVSFHHNRSFHTAARNRTRQSRVVLASTYFADGARILDQPTMVSGDWEKFIPGAGPGDLAASEMNPICWPSGS
ncbi:MAG: snoK [Rhodospirillaceae bacterium]|nr:snoK [Rhodospirillaceae bacterium]|tara:strand:+ start:535 stop:1512 length:978 start_codon:yes stop_codon:yes gene_type:complete